MSFATLSSVVPFGQIKKICKDRGIVQNKNPLSIPIRNKQGIIPRFLDSSSHLFIHAYVQSNAHTHKYKILPVLQNIHHIHGTLFAVYFYRTLDSLSFFVPPIIFLF
jgi:hypothetical protein